MSRYPVSKNRCSKCPMCILVTKDIAGNYLPSSECYYQCLANAESDCEEIKELADMSDS